MIFITLLLKKFLEQLRLVSYTKNLTHRITYRVAVTREKFETLVVPLPISTHSQKVENLTINPEPKKIIEDDVYRVAAYSQQDLKNQKEVVIKFNVLKEPMIYSGDTSFMLSDYKSKFEITTKYTNSLDPEIRELAKGISGDEKNVLVVAKKLYDYVLDSLTYGDPIEGLYSYKDALAREKVDCGGFCMLLSSLLGAMEIPHYLAVGFLITHNPEKQLSQHVWLEMVMPDGGVFPLDPSIDWRRRHGKTTRWGGFGYVGSDRIIFSYGHDFEIKIGNVKHDFELVQNPVAV